MKPLDYFMQAMQAERFRDLYWLISAFSYTPDIPTPLKHLDLVQRENGVFFYDNEQKKEVQIEGLLPKQPPFVITDEIQLTAGQVPNLSEDITTIYGSLLFNYVALVWPFGKKIPFVNGTTSPGKIESIIEKRLVDNPEDGVIPLPSETPEKDPIYVTEYLNFADAMFFLTEMTQIAVPALTEKAITPPDGIEDLKAQLLEENRDRLHDPAVIAGIMKKLIEADSEYLKGDESEGFLITKKSREVVRSKLFLMHGAESGFSDGINVSLVENSLSQGWDITKFPEMNNSLRDGSFKRGTLTMLGGEQVKWLLRASSNIKVTEDDCGTKLGDKIILLPKHRKKYVGFSVVAKDAPVMLTDDNFDEYVNKEVIVRTPMYCSLPLTDFCKCCVGKRLAENPTAVSAAITKYGSVFMSLFLKAMHGKALQTERMNIAEELM